MICMLIINSQWLVVSQRAPRGVPPPTPKGAPSPQSPTPGALCRETRPPHWLLPVGRGGR